ncbi:MAG TPA: hypothetical protein VGO50_10520 [Pyrinomonadaceae bacterium]|jgi:hypothetical protein|nr:hypothetical protein [Pyrinomonadaceae bacterium]
MKKLLPAICLLILLILTATAFYAQKEDQITKSSLSPEEIQKIIKNFSDHETIYRRALNNYSFKRDAIVQTIGFGAGQVTGEYHRTSLFTFDDSGKKYEKILFFPMPTLNEIQITPADLEDLGGVNPFALEPEKLAYYNVTFVGKQRIDELDLYVFDVAPKVMPDIKSGLRLFQGRIWVDDHDLQIVKSKGKGVPEDKKSKYPIVETWRENIGGKYWFPTFATSNDELLFESTGQTVRLRLRIRYTDYKEASATVRILDDDEEVKPTPTPAKKP